MAQNTVNRPLSEREIGEDADIRPFLNKEAIPLLRDIRALLNNVDQVTHYTGSGGSATLPSAEGTGDSLLGRALIYVNTGTGTLTLTAATGDTINGGATATVPTGALAIVVADGSTKWIAFGAGVSTTGDVKIVAPAGAFAFEVYVGGTASTDRRMRVTGDAINFYRDVILSGAPGVGDAGGSTLTVGGEGIALVAATGGYLHASAGLTVARTAGELMAFHGATPCDQAAAIASPAGGATVDTECRAALASLLVAAREKGLIAT